MFCYVHKHCHKLDDQSFIELSPKQRAAVVLHYFEDRPLPEVAGIIGCSHATAKVHVFKARKRLAVLLHDRSDEVADDV